MNNKINITKVLNAYSVMNNIDPGTKDDYKLGVTIGNKTNVVSGKKLRSIQSATLNQTKDYISKTFGPMGSKLRSLRASLIMKLLAHTQKMDLKYCLVL